MHRNDKGEGGQVYASPSPPSLVNLALFPDIPHAARDSLFAASCRSPLHRLPRKRLAWTGRNCELSPVAAGGTSARGWQPQTCDVCPTVKRPQ